ncbi:hypothetical protein N2152v2_006345 [Parachlorella kessleri]
MLRQLASIPERAVVLTPPTVPLPRRVASVRKTFQPRVQPQTTAISAPFRQSLKWVSEAPFGSLPAQPALQLPTLPSLWQAYLRSLETQPLATKSATAFAMTVLSDGVAQVLGGVAAFSVWRCVRMGLYSASVGAVSGHYWHKWLDANVDPQHPISAKAVGGKVALDQLVFTPIMTLAFFAFLKAAEGQPHMILPFIHDKYLSTLLAGYAVWPAVNIITFRFIPQDLRILFGSAVGLVWGTYISMSCVNGAGTCPEPGSHVGGVMEGTTNLQVFEQD